MPKDTPKDRFQQQVEPLVPLNPLNLSDKEEELKDRVRLLKRRSGQVMLALRMRPEEANELEKVILDLKDRYGEEKEITKNDIMRAIIIASLHAYHQDPKQSILVRLLEFL